MDKSTSNERLVRIETKLCKSIEQQATANKELLAELRKSNKLLAEQKKENARLTKFLDQWDAYQKQVSDGSIPLD